MSGKRDCEACPLKPHCCPNALARKITRSIYEGAGAVSYGHGRNVLYLRWKVE